MWGGRFWHRDQHVGGLPKTAVRFFRRPQLRAPVLLAAFEGWNDAGEAASTALGFLAESWDAVTIAEVDHEEFFDFTEARPEVSGPEGPGRKLVWPSTSLAIATVRAGDQDLVVLRGTEPHLRWQTYCDTVVALAKGLGVSRVLTLGAYLSEVTHGRPVPLSGTATTPGLLERFSISPSLYEGPTGIVGVLAAAFADAGIETTSIWASVPCYSLPVSAKAALALARATSLVLERPVALDGLEEQAAEYERRMDELLEEDENVAAYVARLEEMDEPSGDLSVEGLAEEIERFLRGKR
ncbi:MAG: hypothetical protein JWM85_1637 [Acidimicrobiaceae bacterium]|nr:hypothetical protein [Acidimicrobiaceae bacterium]